MKVLFEKRDITDRIEIFLTYKPDATRVPVHPDDYTEARFFYETGYFGDNVKWKLYELGKREMLEEEV